MSGPPITLTRPKARPVRLHRAGQPLPAVVRALRPLHWTKNGIVFAALVFDRKLFDLEAVGQSALAALVFCALSSGIYLINDLRDAESDRLHPFKRQRPIASGEITRTAAVGLATGLIGLAMLASWVLGPEFVAVAGGYVALMIAYSLVLKRVVILDVFAIATGFVIRAAAGAIAIAVEISPWLLVCTMLLALFLGFGKRRHELAMLSDGAGAHRDNLDSYTLPLLDQLIVSTAAATVIAYAVYTFDAASVPANHAMMLTIPIVTYAVFRYLFLIHRRNQGGSPEALLFSDRPLLLAIVAWGVVSVAILHLAS